ncbi:hypothetical protein [Armatimonas sp.]|uniref:hypothetical protein n=1 Tax=Armatimonas sp. TaxID=1872638 RepID=UPI003753AB0D
MHLKNLFTLSALGLAALAALPAHAQEQKARKHLLLGPQLGFYTPASRLARDRFGGSWTNIGLGKGDVAAPKAKGEVNFDLNFISSRSKEAEVLLAPIGLVYRRGVSEGRSTRPYFGASVNLLVTNFRSSFLLDNIPSGWRTGTGGSVFGGVSMGNRFYVEGRYYAFSKVRNFDFSGMNLGLGWRL